MVFVPKVRFSRTAQKILLALLKNGAMKVEELVIATQSKKTPITRDLWGRISSARTNSCFRTLKNLKRNGLVRKKVGLKFTLYCPYYKGRFFYALERGDSWYGWYLTKRPRNNKCIYGLTPQGRKAALKFRKELEELTKEWQPFL